MRKSTWAVVAALTVPVLCAAPAGALCPVPRTFRPT
jgi:hypothetical protein